MISSFWGVLVNYVRKRKKSFEIWITTFTMGQKNKILTKSIRFTFQKFCYLSNIIFCSFFSLCGPKICEILLKMLFSNKKLIADILETCHYVWKSFKIFRHEIWVNPEIRVARSILQIGGHQFFPKKLLGFVSNKNENMFLFNNTRHFQKTKTVKGSFK
jgi:hypothetical protein